MGFHVQQRVDWMYRGIFPNTFYYNISLSRAQLADLKEKRGDQPTSEEETARQKIRMLEEQGGIQPPISGKQWNDFMAYVKSRR